MNTRKFAYLRIAFGLVWAADAIEKWRPAFQQSFAGNFSITGLPAFLSAWMHIFESIVSINPHLFGILTALAETAIALGLIFGFMTRTAIVGGAIFSFILWTTVQAFGMFWMTGATDLGAGIAYAFVFIALWYGESWKALSLDSRIS